MTFDEYWVTRWPENGMPMAMNLAMREIAEGAWTTATKVANESAPTEWVKVTEKLLAQQPDLLFGPLWVSMNGGEARSGRYEWRQGRCPDRFYCDDGDDMHALNNCYIMPLVKPEPPPVGMWEKTISSM